MEIEKQTSSFGILKTKKNGKIRGRGGGEEIFRTNIVKGKKYSSI
jgi:hypothetical protein